MPGARQMKEWCQRRTRLSLLVAIALIVLVFLGIWQGDFHETVMNGTTL